MDVSTEQPVALSIAGSDSGGGAGIQADLKTFAANGVFGTTAITCLTAQNPDSVTEVFPVDPGFVVEQVRQVDRFFSLRAVKTGMLFSEEIIEAAGDFLQEKISVCPVVVDPVMVSTSGAVLLKPEAVRTLKRSVLPFATLITPNLDEASVLLGHQPPPESVAEAAQSLAGEFGTAVLLKGGHLPGNEVRDVLAEPGGTVREWKSPRVEDVDTHGSGCTLASAIAAHLALNRSVIEAVSSAQNYLRLTLHQTRQTGPRRFINHFPGSIT